ncbi:MAG: hypothetical protein LBC86_05945 [Oscillospiraceae bacterium]|jgi:hypothetical protein|nr:hypothetical protein [Oscillospiraceae bacterium]
MRSEIIQSGSNKKITLPQELQREMINFFVKTSIPRKKRAEGIKDGVDHGNCYLHKGFN